MARTNDLPPLIVPPAASPVRRTQGLLIEFNAETFENVCRFNGVDVPNVPVMQPLEALSYQAGDTIILEGLDPSQGMVSWAIASRVVVPGENGGTAKTLIARNQIKQVDALLGAAQSIPTGQTATGLSVYDNRPKIDDFHLPAGHSFYITGGANMEYYFGSDGNFTQGGTATIFALIDNTTFIQLAQHRTTPNINSDGTTFDGLFLHNPSVTGGILVSDQLIGAGDHEIRLTFRVDNFDSLNTPLANSFVRDPYLAVEII